MFIFFSSAFMLLVALYVITRVIWFSPWPLGARCLVSLLIVLASQKLTLTRLFMGSPNAYMPQIVMQISGLLLDCMVMLFLLTLSRDLILGGMRLAGATEYAGLLRRISFLPLLVLALAGGGYAFWSAVRVPAVRPVSLVIPGLSAAHEGLRVVQLSDLHMGPLFRRPWLTDVVASVNALQPDIVVITGDVVDASPAQLAADVAPLGDLKARYGVFLSVGNHEYYSGFEAWAGTRGAFANLGLTVLRNEHRVLTINNAPFVVAGVTDAVAVNQRGAITGQTESAGQTGQTERAEQAERAERAERAKLFAPPSAGQALQGAPVGTRLMLAHRPSLAFESAKAGASLQLSGHTHGGILWPLAFAVAYANQGFVRGVYQVDGMPLYVSAGSGLWGGFPLRLGVPSEITLITLHGTSPAQ